ncbi:MAG: hypothetical protein CM1200mP2_09670 [Planctomycetaceae bacterium]|nr:MAG: hypothetical protein CM1200mP2_09670 [Planctomycetaceae bacterium]
MDLKQSGSHLFLVGHTRKELGEATSPGQLARRWIGSRVDLDTAPNDSSVHNAIGSGSVRSFPDLSEGGLAVQPPRWLSPGNGFHST